jgi:NADPH-dependent ferric siderophore reductase
MSPKAFAEYRVLRTQALAPRLRRVVFDAPGFTPNDFTDSYVKLAFGDPDSAPPVRTYTVAGFDAGTSELSIDFVVHGDSGVAGPWAAAAQPGDSLWVRTPGGAYRPDPTADAHLFVGDEAAIASIGAALAALPAAARGAAFIEVDGPDDELPLPGVSDVTVHWLHRGDAPPGSTTLLDDAVRAWDWPTGRVQAFVHGESALLKSVRPYVRERIDRRDLSVSAYWKVGETEEGFRAWKARQDEAVLRPQ